MPNSTGVSYKCCPFPERSSPLPMFPGNVKAWPSWLGPCTQVGDTDEVLGLALACSGRGHLGNESAGGTSLSNPTFQTNT